MRVLKELLLRLCVLWAFMMIDACLLAFFCASAGDFATSMCYVVTVCMDLCVLVVGSREARRTLRLVLGVVCAAVDVSMGCSIGP